MTTAQVAGWPDGLGLSWAARHGAETKTRKMMYCRASGPLLEKNKLVKKKLN